ncbi:MAG: hypothetical protein GWN58_05515, partial [Anaerolineae bacterium]|nr:hypothetical protein [Anaerolineae bacterium]
MFFLPEPEGQGEKLQWQSLDLEAIQQQVEPPLVSWVLVQMEPLEVDGPQPIPQPELELS